MSEAQRKWPFASSILLARKQYDAQKLAADLLNDWQMNIQPALAEDPNALVFKSQDILCTITYMPARVPDNEAARGAVFNTYFPDAVRVANTHKAHLLVVVLARKGQEKEAGRLLVKLSCACLKQPEATGIYTIGTVFAPQFYLQAAASAFSRGQYPAANLVFVELYSQDGGKPAVRIPMASVLLVRWRWKSWAAGGSRRN